MVQRNKHRHTPQRETIDTLRWPRKITGQKLLERAESTDHRVALVKR